MVAFKKLCASQLFAAALAWDLITHHKICEIAAGILGQQKNAKVTMDRIQHMLKTPLEQDGAFGHTHYNLAELHVQPMRPDWSCSLGAADKLPTNMIRHYKPCNNDDDNHCLLGAMYWFFQKYAHHELLDYKPHYTPPISAVKELKKIQRLDMPDSYVMRWLLTLVGDIHQPLHFGNQGDKRGENLLVEFRSKKMSFWDYWERELPSSFVKSSNMGDHLKAIQGSKVKSDPEHFFADWAAETQALACKVYGMLGYTKDTKIDEKTTFPISEDLHTQFEDIMKTQIWRSAERTALLLENVLEHKKVKERIADGRHPVINPRHHTGNLGNNAIIAVVFFPMFYLSIMTLEKKAGLHVIKTPGQHSI